MYGDTTIVVPHRGTWIEIEAYGIRTLYVESYLTEVRGLKFRIWQ